MIVACALIVSNGRVLATRRDASGSNPLMWEFPGGKVESGESPEAALLRELKEALHLRAEIISALEPVPWQGQGPDITLHPFICLPVQEFAPVPVDHTEIRWIRPEEASQLTWAPADQPLVEILSTLI